MKTIFVDDFKRETAHLTREFASPNHVDRDRWLNVDALILRPNGCPTALLLKRRIDPKLCEIAFNIGWAMNESLVTRPSAVGSDAMPRIKKNGRLGSYAVTPDTVLDVLEREHARQGTLGATRGTRARPAQVTELTTRHPELLNQLRPLIERADQLFDEFLPSFRSFQRAEVKTAPHLRLWKTAFSSAYFNKALQSAYHRDSENLLGAMSVLLPLGDFSGGQLVIPRWRIGIAFAPGDVLLFDPGQLHGNLPITGMRVSLVLYCVRGIAV
jgi:hypothetical protein